MQNNPLPTTGNNAPPSLPQKVGSGIGSYFSNIGRDIGSNVQEGGQALYNSATGQENPFAAGATIFKNIAGSLASPINNAINPILDKTGISGGLNNVNQGFLNSPVGGATTDLLSKAPGPVLGGASDILQGGGNMMELGGVQNVWDKAYGLTNTTTSSADAVASRTADATPAYDKSMTNQNVKTPRGDIVPRVNEGEGLTGKRTVTTSASEATSGKELENLSNYPDKGTNLQKLQAVGEGINAEAENMRGGLQAEDKANPLDTNAQKVKLENVVKQNLPKDIQEKLGILSSEDQQTLKGMQDKSGAPQPPNGKFDLTQPGDRINLPKTAANNYYTKVIKALDSYDGTREGTLNLRQTIDKAFKSEGGKYAYGSDSQNALQETHTAIRDALNEDLKSTTQNTDTQASLDKQTNLYRASDTLDAKAKVEATSEIGRFFQNHPLLHRLATRDFMRLAGTATGATILTTMINKFLQGK